MAPLTVLLLSVAGENAPGFAVDLTSPVTLATLRTQLSADGTIAPREGLAIVVEPEPVDYHIPIEHSQGLWLSLDAESVRANRQHLVVDDSGITCRAPLLGVQESVTLIIEGQPRGELGLPAEREGLASWQRESKRARSLLSSVLLSCVFALGLAVPKGIPSLQPKQEDAGEVTAKPDWQ